MHESRLAVVIATVGRPDETADCLEAIRGQTRVPERIVLSVTSEDDLPGDGNLDSVEVVMGPKGSSAQRNRGLELVLDDCDIVIFLDDDYIASPDALAGLDDFFHQHPDIAGMNGHLIADGISGPGLSADEAHKLIQSYDPVPPGEAIILDGALDGLYGCNMAYRASAIGDVRFDEDLPLYAWQEDIDFAHQVKSRGRLVRTNAFAGVHRGVKSARTSEVRLGY